MNRSTELRLLPTLPKEHLFTRDEAAEYLNVTTRFVTRCVQERRIRHVRIGRMVRIPESALVEYLASNSVAVKQAR